MNKSCARNILADCGDKISPKALPGRSKAQESLSNSLLNTAPAPSWSWASLPLRTVIKMQDDLIGTKDFALLEKSGLGQGQADNTLHVTMRGANIKSVKVRGPLRHFVGSISHWVAWSTIQRTNGNEGRYDLAKYIAESVHSVNNKNGKIFVYESHMQPIAGQLNCLSPQSEEIGWIKLS